ncbi:MAG: hypothetical protein Q8T08_13655, partial [Ignavibacteria bacterium]|nr:hypothetical protein [Ignavibacteria bacterium]
MYKDGKLKEALQSYQKALEIFPDDKYTLGQVAKINETIQTANKKQEDYTKNMDLGDQLVQANKFEEALLQFNQAALLFPDLPLPKEKIASTTKLLAEQKDKELQFSKLKEDAKTLNTRKNYKDAIDKLNEALKIYPKDIDVNNLLSETQALYAKSLQYNEMLASADASYENKNLEQSKVLYEKALAIWPEQAYPADMIQKINTTLNSAEHQRATLVPKYLADAQQLFDSKKYEQAIEVYNTLLEIDPENKIANDRLVEISFLITQQKAEQQALAEFESLLKKGDQAVNEKKYDEALVAYKKADEILPNDKNIAAKIVSTEKILNDQRLLTEKSDKYQMLIAAGDKLYQQSELEKAKLSYQEASTLDSEKAYPKDQIILIDKKLSELAATQQLDNEFNTFIATAQQQFVEKNWNAAKTSYSKASQLKPESQLPKQQIEAIDRILAENAKLNEEYNDFIASGTENLKQNKLELALEAYQNAASIKPDEQLPKEKIESITLLISEKQSIAQKEKEYSDLITLADKQYGSNEFDTSLENYRKASLLFADRAYPTTQIGLINKVKEENA